MGYVLGRSLHRAIIYSVGIALFIVGLCLYTTVRLIGSFTDGVHKDASKVALIVQEEVGKYIFGLQGTKGVIVVDELAANPAVFRRYAKSRDFFSNFAGAAGYGFIRYVKEKDFKTYIARAKKERPGFNLRPEVKTGDHMIVELLEPATSNPAGPGFDVAFEPNRKGAALTSAMTGQATLSHRIWLVNRKDKYGGFLYFLPVYRSDLTGVPVSSGNKFDDLVGWAYAPIIFDQVIESVVQKIPSSVGVKIQLEYEDKEAVHFGEKVEKSPLLDNEAVAFVQVGGQKWAVRVTALTGRTELIVLVLWLACIAFATILIREAILSQRRFREAEQSLDEKSEWLRALIEGAGYAVIAAKPDGIITTFNPAAEKMLGYSSSEIVNKSTPAIFHDLSEVVSRAKELTKELGREIEPGFDVFTAKALINGSETHEWTYIRKDGYRFPIKLNATALYGSEGKLIGFLGLAEDLTESKQLNAVIDAQRVSMLENAKLSVLGEMAGGVAHEINTPLGVIIGKSDHLLHKIKSGFSDVEEISAQIQKISDTGNRIAKIVRGLRTFSRNSSSDPMEDVQVASIVEATLDLCRERIVHSDIDLRLRVDASLRMNARAAEISQVLMNLVGNSVDAIRELKDKWIEIDVKQVHHRIHIVVTDSGPGIAPDVAAKMMNPFFTTKEVGKGTGLGLSVSKGIVESHAGQLRYDERSANTRFVIDLPKPAPQGRAA